MSKERVFLQTNSMQIDNGLDNTKFYELLDYIKKNAKPLGSRWSGDYLVSEFREGNTVYAVWENMDLGIMSEIEIYKEVDMKTADRWEEISFELREIREDESYGTDSSMGERCYEREKELVDALNKLRETL